MLIRKVTTTSGPGVLHTDARRSSPRVDNRQNWLPVQAKMPADVPVSPGGNRPSPPPVYRPQKTPPVQPKMPSPVHARPGGIRQSPPPVYRPQKAPPIQPKMPAAGGPNPIGVRPPAPPVYRPQNTAPVQPKMPVGTGTVPPSSNRAPGIAAANPRREAAAIQMTAATDSADALANINYLNNVGFPGLVASATAVRNDVQAEVAAYALGNPLNPNPAPGHQLSHSAEGLKRFTERMIESVDGGWTEVDEAHRLYGKANPVQFPRLGIPGVAPDICYQKPGGWTGVEVKSVNSANVGQVNTQILNADAQLGGYVLNRSKVLIWIAHNQNQWPGVVGWAGRNTNALLRTAVRNQLNGMNIQNADQVNILDVNVNYDGGRKDISAEWGGLNWVVTVL
jgi:hypothetical protein